MLCFCKDEQNHVMHAGCCCCLVTVLARFPSTSDERILKMFLVQNIKDRQICKWFFFSNVVHFFLAEAVSLAACCHSNGPGTILCWFVIQVWDRGWDYMPSQHIWVTTCKLTPCSDTQTQSQCICWMCQGICQSAMFITHINNNRCCWHLTDGGFDKVLS